MPLTKAMPKLLKKNKKELIINDIFIIWVYLILSPNVKCEKYSVSKIFLILTQRRI